MIESIKAPPMLCVPSAEGIKIRNLAASYEDAQIFAQDKDRAYISLLDGDAVIENHNADIDELKSFLGFLSPKSVFSDIETLEKLGFKSIKKARVLSKKCREENPPLSDTLKSDDVYRMLLRAGFSLPQFDAFAVDFCRRLNKGTLKYFARKDQCMAITIIADEFCLLSGIASFKKGMGSVALGAAAAQNSGKLMLCCCEEKLMEFYLKNGFEYIYEVGYVEEL